MMAFHTVERTVDEQSRLGSQLRQGYLDAPEYTPRGVPIAYADDPNRMQVETSEAPLASASDPNAVLLVSARRDGSMALTVDSPKATFVRLRRHYFPHWQVSDARGHDFVVTSDAREGIVTFVAPAGKTSIRLQHGTAPKEMLGRLISLLACLVVAAGAPLLAWRRSRASPDSCHGSYRQSV